MSFPPQTLSIRRSWRGEIIVVIGRVARKVPKAAKSLSRNADPGRPLGKDTRPTQ